MDWFKFSEHQELKQFFAMLAPSWMVLHCQELVFPFQKGATSQDLSEDKLQLPLGELITCKFSHAFLLATMRTYNEDEDFSFDSNFGQ